MWGRCRVDVGSMWGRCGVDVGSMWGRCFILASLAFSRENNRKREEEDYVSYQLVSFYTG